MTWVPSLGAGIVTHPYISSGEKQISLLVGDHMQIFHECEGWFHGQNVLTKIEGIFPKCCVSIYPARTFDERFLLAQSEDLLQIEARLSIRYALDFILKSTNYLLICRATDCIGLIIQKLDMLRSIQHGEENEICPLHTELSKSLNFLRDVLKIPAIPRTKLNEYSTFTTWGEEQFAQTNRLTQRNYVKSPEYVMFRIQLEPVAPKKIQYYRIALFQPMKYPFITLPTYRRVGPQHLTCEVIFSSLEKKDMKNPTYLVVYVYDVDAESEPTSTSTSQSDFRSEDSKKPKSTIQSKASSPLPRDLKQPSPRQNLSSSRVGSSSLVNIYNQYSQPRRYTASPGELASLDLNQSSDKSRRNTEPDRTNSESSVSFQVDYISKYPIGEIIGCAILKLPSCKTDLAYQRGTSTFTMQVYASTALEYMHNFHEAYILNQQWVVQTLRPVSEIKCRYTPFYGNQMVFMDREKINIKKIVEPCFLPSLLPAKTNISRLVFSINKISQHSSKKSRLVVRVLNMKKRVFLNIIEKPFSTKYMASSWKSVPFKGVKMTDISFEDTFAIDILSIPEEELKNIYITVEIQRFLIIENVYESASYTTIPIINNDGMIRETFHENIQLKHFTLKSRGSLAQAKNFSFPAQGRDGGSFDFSLKLSSTILTMNKALYKLIHYERFSKDLENSLKNFDSGGLSEYSRFIRPILTALLKIMVTTKSFYASLAFDKMTSMLASIFTHSRLDYRKNAEETISFYFKPEVQNTINNRGTNLFQFMLPRLINALHGDNSTTQFRDMLKCSSFFMAIIVKSMSMYLRLVPNALTGQKLFDMVVPYFDHLNTMVSDYPNDKNDLHKNASLFTNQLLVLQQFYRIAGPLLYCFKCERVANIMVAFINSIRYFPEDKKQIAIDKAKYRILLSLSSARLIFEESVRHILFPMFTKELAQAAALPHCVHFVVPILWNLFSVARSDLIYQFIPVISQSYQLELERIKTSTMQTIKANARANMLNMNKFLLILAFASPEKVPFDILFELIQQDSIGAQERLFVLSNSLNSLANQLKSSITNDQKYQILKIYFELSISRNKNMNTEIESILDQMIYPKKSDYGACKELFFSLQSNQEALLSFIKPLFHCFINDESSDLISIYISIVGTTLSNDGIGNAELLNKVISFKPNSPKKPKSSKIPKIHYRPISPNNPPRSNNPNISNDSNNPNNSNNENQQFLFDSNMFNQSLANSDQLLQSSQALNETLDASNELPNDIVYYKKDSVLDKSFTAAFELMDNPRFNVFDKMYQAILAIQDELSMELLRYFQLLYSLISSLKILREFAINKDSVMNNEESVSDSVNALVTFCNRTNNIKILMRLLFTQAHMQMHVKNNLEAVSSFIQFLQYIPCNTDDVDALYQMKNVTTGIELHTHILLTCIDLCKTCNYEEIGLDIIKRIKDTIIQPYKYYELMKTVLEKEANLYGIISTKERIFSTYYLVHFVGNGFEFYNRNKMFIYRRPPDFTLDMMKQELEKKFPNIKCSTQYLQKVPTYIFVTTATVSYEGEVTNPYIRPMLTTKGMFGCKYHYQYLLYKSAHIFKIEMLVPFNIQMSSFVNCDPDSLKSVWNSVITGTKQSFYHTKESFPFISTRIEIDMSKNASRVLSPIDTAILHVRRRSLLLMVEVLNLRKIYESSVSDSTNSVVLSILSEKNGDVPVLCSQALKRANDNGSISKFLHLLDTTIIDALSGKLKTFAETFFVYQTQQNCPTQFNPQKNQFLIDSFRELVVTFSDAISIANIIKTDKTDELLKKIGNNFGNYKEYIDSFIS